MQLLCNLLSVIKSERKTATLERSWGEERVCVCVFVWWVRGEMSHVRRVEMKIRKEEVRKKKRGAKKEDMKYKREIDE